MYNLQGSDGVHSSIAEVSLVIVQASSKLGHDIQISGKDQPLSQDVSGSWFWFLVENNEARNFHKAETRSGRTQEPGGLRMEPRDGLCSYAECLTAYSIG